MGTHQNVIEINGKKFNAITGKQIVPKGHVKSVDGFTKKPSAKKRTTRTPAAHNKKTTQKSKTLMRKSVKKPTVKQKAKPTRVAGISKPTLKTSQRRHAAASATRKSPMVSRFNDAPLKNSVIKKVQHMPVKKRRESKKIHTTHTSPALKQSPPTRKAPGSTVMVEKALANATAHEFPAHHVKKRSRISRKLGVSTRAVAISTTVLAGVLLGGFFAIQNIPNLSMRVASARAGFDASLPTYSPSGFSFTGPINYNPGQVTITYSSNTDDRGYNLTQRASNWNSDALLSNYVTVNSKPYQTYLDRGRTLYIYDGSNATWVDSGIWYQIEGKSNMTTDQLVRIAASL